MTKILKLLPTVLILGFFGGCLTGCHFTTADRGDWQLTFGTQIGVSSNSSATQAKSSAGVEFPALEEWIKAKPEEPLPAPEQPVVPPPRPD